jgi:23S rRNA (uridine2552-2'-O)-methyltransferase
VYHFAGVLISGKTMTRGKQSRRWLQQHGNDYYVRHARARGLRSRAVFKLEEIDGRDRLFRTGMTVVDLGAAPGGWSQYAVQRIGRRGRIIAVDMLPMVPLRGVEFMQGDFREENTLRRVLEQLGPAGADLVLSDMAPNITGMRAVDQAQAMHLAESSLQLAQKALKSGGGFVVKLFQGEGIDCYVRSVRAAFGKAALRKPAASHRQSREVYLVAKNYQL